MTTARPRRGTRHSLLLRHRSLLAATFVMLLSSLWVLQTMSRSFTEADSLTAPAVLEIAQARKALAEADSAAVKTFMTPESQLTGFRPGEEYQDQIGIANQILAQAAEHNSAGALGSRILQTVEGALAAYANSIAQASERFRQGDTTVATANLLDASALMHNKDGGILAQLERLQKAELGNIEKKVSPNRTDLVTVVTWAGPIVLVLALLSMTQVFMARRFRRTFNTKLLTATVLVLAAVGTGSALAADDRGHLASAQKSLKEAVSVRDDEVARADYEGRQGFAELIRPECGREADGCGTTIATYIADSRKLRSNTRSKPARTAIIAGKKAAEQTDAARMNPYLYALPGVAMPLAVSALILWGFRARIDEYRHRPR